MSTNFLDIVGAVDATLRDLLHREIDKKNRQHLNDRRDEDHTRSARSIENNNQWV